MPTSTYTSLGTITLASTDSEIVFSSIPATYRDLIVVIQGKLVVGVSQPTSIEVQPNSDASNGSMVYMQGTGSSTLSGTVSRIFCSMNNSQSAVIIQAMDYAQTDKHKTFLIRDNSPTGDVRATAGRWASTAAMSSLRLLDVNGVVFDAGTTFSMYGVN